MDREARAEFDEIRSILRETAELGRATEKRMDLAEKQIQATRKLVEAGIKIVGRLAADTRELKRSQKAFLDSLRNAGNGRRHAA